MAIFYISKKHHIIRREVMAWKKSSFGEIFKKEKEINGKLEEFQESMVKGDLSFATHDEK